MASRKVKAGAAAVNQGSIGSAAAVLAAPSRSISKVHQHAAIFAAVGKIAGECFTRDDLPDGASERVDVCITARVEGGDLYRKQFHCDLAVGHASQRASSTGAPQEDVIAWILGHVNAATRESILAKLPEVFAANGEALPVSEGDKAAAEAMLKRLRAKKTQDVRGSVSVKVSEGQVPMGLVG